MKTPAEIPSRLRGERLSRPPRGLGHLRSLLGMRVRETDSDVVRLRDGLLRGDPAADAFVSWSLEHPAGLVCGRRPTGGLTGRGRQLFERAVEHGLRAVPDAPDCLVQWLEPLETEPAWLDHELLRLACRTSWRVGTNPAADADSRSLARALHELPQRRAHSALEKTLAHAHTRYQTAVSRLTLGNRVADELGLPREPLTTLLPFLSAGRFGVDTIRRLVPGATTLAERRGLAVQRRMTAALIGDERVSYVPYAERPTQGEAAA